MSQPTRPQPTPRPPSPARGSVPDRPATRRAAPGSADVAAATGSTAWPFSPACCQPEAFALMFEQTAELAPATAERPAKRRLDTDDGLFAAACAVALHAKPSLEIADSADQLDALASCVRETWPTADGVAGDLADRPTQAILAHLHNVLFEEQGFRGNGGDYYHVGNSFLPTVLTTKRGLPISLSLVYKLVAGRLGVRCWGVGLPGHFVAGVDCHGPILVDCFHAGRLLDRRDAEERVAACAGAEAGFSDDMLRPVTHRHWITRLIQNLLQSYTAAGRYADVAAMLEIELLLWPDQLHLQRDLGLVLARLGEQRPASVWLGRYLTHRPDDPQRADLEELLGVLG